MAWPPFCHGGPFVSLPAVAAVHGALAPSANLLRPLCLVDPALDVPSLVADAAHWHAAGLAPPPPGWQAARPFSLRSFFFPSIVRTDLVLVVLEPTTKGHRTFSCVAGSSVSRSRLLDLSAICPGWFLGHGVSYE